MNEATVEPALGNDQAEQLFVQHLPRLYRLAKRLLGSEADAEEALPEVLLQALENPGSFRTEGMMLLDRVAVNCASAHCHRMGLRRAREVWAPSGEELPRAAVSQERSDQRVLAETNRKLIELAISRLPDLYREPFVLSEIEGMDDAKIGEILGLSLADVRIRLQRARMLLWDALACGSL
jgi:RNA polymerase sigma-70 factor (ECF subfamily)